MLKPFFFKALLKFLCQLYRHRLRVQLREESVDRYSLVSHEIILVILDSKPVLHKKEAVATLPVADSDLLGLLELVILVDKHHPERDHRVREAPHFLHRLDIGYF